MLVLDYFGIFVSHRWGGLSRESWPYILALIAALPAPSAASSAAEQEPGQASSTAEAVADESDEPGRWRCPSNTPDPDVLCTDVVYRPAVEQPVVAEITTFSEAEITAPWYLRPFDWLRGLFTRE